MKHMTNRKLKNILLYVIYILIIVIVLFPFFWSISGSFKTRMELFSQPPVWIPQGPDFLENYIWLLYRFPKIPSRMLNSLIVALSSAAISLILGSLAAYSFTRYKFKGKDNLAFWILSTRFFPPAVVVIPIFILMTTAGLVDVILSLILMHTVINLPFTVWLMRGFFVAIPTEIEESALVDGCSRLGAFFRITLPLSAPGLAASAIFSVIFSWNEFYYAFVLTHDRAATLPVEFMLLRMGGVTLPWGAINAAGVMFMIPIIIFALIVQKYLVRALTFRLI